jgi:hypothetical protein
MCARAKKSIKKAINQQQRGESQDHLAGISAFAPLMNGSLIELLIDALWRRRRRVDKNKGQRASRSLGAGSTPILCPDGNENPVPQRVTKIIRPSKVHDLSFCRAGVASRERASAGEAAIRPRSAAAAAGMGQRQ